MFNKLYESIKRYLQDNYKFILFIVLSYIFLTLPLPYYVYMPGGTIDIDEKVIIEKSYESSGSFNFAYVSEVRGTIPTALLSFAMNKWDLVKKEDVVFENEGYADVSYRNNIYLDEANQNATIVAYNKAGKKVNITDRHHHIVYVSTLANTSLEIGDEIISLEGKDFSSDDEYSDIVNSNENGDILSILVKKDNIITDKMAEIMEFDDYLSTGIYFITLYDYNTDPVIEWNFNDYESGPSGGLMLTLTIYNKLIEEDITKGYKIVGTGTIEENSSVGQISGVSYKILGAVQDGADIFFVPTGDNYDEAITIKEENNLDISIIGISTFDEALNYLNQL